MLTDDEIAKLSPADDRQGEGRTNLSYGYVAR